MAHSEYPNAWSRNDHAREAENTNFDRWGSSVALIANMW